MYSLEELKLSVPELFRNKEDLEVLSKIDHIIQKNLADAHDFYNKEISTKLQEKATNGYYQAILTSLYVLEELANEYDISLEEHYLYIDDFKISVTLCPYGDSFVKPILNIRMKDFEFINLAALEKEENDMKIMNLVTKFDYSGLQYGDRHADIYSVWRAVEKDFKEIQERFGN